MSDRQVEYRRRAEERRKVMEMLSLLRAGADLRRGKVKRLRSAIQSRTYENDLKLMIAMERMMGTANFEWNEETLDEEQGNRK